MEIEEQWRNFEPEDDMLEALFEKVKVSRLQSHGVLSKLRKNILSSTILSLVATAYLFWATFYFAIWQVQVMLAVVDVFCIWILVISVRLYRGIDPQIDPSLSLLEQLKNTRAAMQHYIDVQQKVSIFIYPLSIAAGFLIGGVVGAGKPIESFIGEKVVIISLIVAIVVLTPVNYFFARGLFKLFFGKQLQQLDRLIKELEE